MSLWVSPVVALRGSVQHYTVEGKTSLVLIASGLLLFNEDDAIVQVAAVTPFSFRT